LQRLLQSAGLQLQRELALRASSLPILFLTGRGDIAASVQAMKHGAADFLTKPVDDAELLAAIQEALATDRQRRGALVERERQVLEQVVRGRLNKRIAAELGTVEETVKFHRGNLMRKLSVRSVADLVKLAERAGVGAAPQG
jgi:FixJ family two-component response regulator